MPSSTSSTSAPWQAYLKRTASIKQLLPPEILARLNALEAKQDYGNPKYDKIMMEDLYPKMICRIQPWPAPLTRAFRLANQRIYNHYAGQKRVRRHRQLEGLGTMGSSP
jgi:proline iminopeptidase